VLSFLDERITDLFQQQPGQDITEPMKKVLAAMSSLDAAKQTTCLKNVFYIGQTDFRATPRCKVQNFLLLAFSICIMTTIAAKCKILIKSLHKLR
jgi:chitin synthase